MAGAKRSGGCEHVSKGRSVIRTKYCHVLKAVLKRSILTVY